MTAQLIILIAPLADNLPLFSGGGFPEMDSHPRSIDRVSRVSYTEPMKCSECDEKALEGMIHCPAHDTDRKQTDGLEPRYVRYTVVIEQELSNDYLRQMHQGVGRKAAELLERRLNDRLGNDDDLDLRVVRRFVERDGEWPLDELPTHFQDDPIETVIMEVDTDDEA